MLSFPPLSSPPYKIVTKKGLGRWILLSNILFFVNTAFGKHTTVLCQSLNYNSTRIISRPIHPSDRTDRSVKGGFENLASAWVVYHQSIEQYVPWPRYGPGMAPVPRSPGTPPLFSAMSRGPRDRRAEQGGSGGSRGERGEQGGSGQDPGIELYAHTAHTRSYNTPYPSAFSPLLLQGLPPR